MISIAIGNSDCKITGLDQKDFIGIKEALSYALPAQQNYYSGGWKSKRRTLLGKDGTFPTGLLYIVRKYLGDRTYKEDDRRIEPGILESFVELDLPFKPYPEQEDAAEAARVAKRGIIVAPTGVGKSVMIALLVKKLCVKTLIVTPNLALKEQLTTSLRSCLGTLNDLVTVANVDSLDLSKSLISYDCVIIDEFHHSGAKTYRKLNKRCWGNVFYKFGFTATPFRSQDEEQLLLESVLSEVIYRIDYRTAVDRGFIVPVEAYYIEIPKTTPEGNNWHSVYSSLVVSNKVRNDIIHELLIRSHANGDSTLCLVKEIAHGEALTSEGAFNFLKGENEDNADILYRFNNRKFNILIGTTGVLGEGVDTKPAEYVIIAGLGKSPNQLMQQVGRGVRVYPGKESCKVILFKDSSHKWTLNHYKEQCKILKKEYGVVPLEITIDL